MSLYSRHLDPCDIAAQIDNFANSLPSYYDYSQSNIFHDEINRIAISARTLGERDRNQMMRYLLERTEQEFGKSAIISHGRNKPFGYAGDFQIIDWTYTKHLGSDPRGAFWDGFYHRQVAPLAVCERKDRFSVEVRSAISRATEKPRILNLGSGPAREVLEAIVDNHIASGDIEVVCVDVDERAIRYAQKLLGAKMQRNVSFHHGNALRYRPRGTFDLIWSAGLFDYLDNRLAAFLLKTLYKALAPSGRLIIGNFADTHVTRAWVEWCGAWFLIHRSSQDLLRLAQLAAIPAQEATTTIDRQCAIRFLEVVPA